VVPARYPPIRAPSGWRTPATPRARKPLGARIGGYLAGTTGPFTHDRAHLRDLRAFVEGSG